MVTDVQLLQLTAIVGSAVVWGYALSELFASTLGDGGDQQ